MRRIALWLGLVGLVACGGADGDDAADARSMDGGSDAAPPDMAAVEGDARSPDGGAADGGLDAAAPPDADLDAAAPDMAAPDTEPPDVEGPDVEAPDMAVPDAEPPGCAPGVTVSDPDAVLPPALVGHYADAFDCTRDEGGAWFGGDFTRCLRQTDGDGRLWNTGCGWELGQIVDGRWQRAARTYSGQCAGLPWTQRVPDALTTGVLYDGFGALLEGVRFDRCPTPDAPCAAGVEIEGPAAPAELVGRYAPSTDCARDEGGAWFGGSDFTRCFHKADGSGWTIWNTGCGWEIGRLEDDRWQRTLRTYSGQCAEMPETQLDARALTTGLLFDGMGQVITGVRLTHCPGRSDLCGPPGAETEVLFESADRALQAGVGAYTAATDCARDEGGAWFGGVDYTRCFRRDDGSAWRIWNTGCGWEVGQHVARQRGQPPMWSRVARTYSGLCAEMPSPQLDDQALTTGLLYDGFGDVLPDTHLALCPGTPVACEPGATVSLVGGEAPPAYAGRYAEARDCTRDEGGAWFGGSDFTRCFRGPGGWTIWNTGCGWELGRLEPMGWTRVARTYSGQCAEIPVRQLGVEALTTGVLYDSFGDVLPDLRVDYCAP